MTWEMVIVCFFAGAAAGIGTGFAGMSAAAVIAPILATFLGIPIYDAIGIGLLSDVLASAISAYTYKKSNNLNIKKSLVLMLTMLVLTIIGSFIASFMPERSMNNTMQIAMIIIGLRFIIKPVTTPKEKFNNTSKRNSYPTQTELAKLLKSVAEKQMIEEGEGKAAYCFYDNVDRDTQLEYFANIVKRMASEEVKHC